MEISKTLKTDIKDIQGGLVKCIRNHQALVLKLKEDPALETDVKVELIQIQKQIVELNDRQKILLQQLRKELEDNSVNGQLPGYNFNLYKIKPGHLETKKRRRKDLSLAPKVISCRTTLSPPSLSPSPTPSSSSLSDDSVDYVSPFMLPIPVPKARPKLLPDIKENPFLSGINRRDLRPPRLRKSQKPLSDEEVFKDIPVYYDPAPSPPPADEKDLKARFMSALGLIPKEMLSEILNRKVERKRRSTATNNPNFVYNNDWEIPAVSRYNQWKRSKTYLSPHKVSKLESSKKCKVDEFGEVRHPRKDKEAESDKIARMNIEEKADGKSRNSTPDSCSSNMLCFICRSSGSMAACRECTASYHLSCLSPGSSASCPNCKHKRSFHDEGSSEDSSKEEFISKCPNVAESYSKLKKYIEHHTDSDAAALYIEKENYKMELVIKNQELYEEKHKLEEKAAELSEALLLQEDSRNELLKEEEKILAKIKIVVDFVKAFQKTSEQKPSEDDCTKIEENDTHRNGIENGEDDNRENEGAKELHKKISNDVTEKANTETDTVKNEEVKNCSSSTPFSQESLENDENITGSLPFLTQEGSSEFVKDKELKKESSSPLFNEGVFDDPGVNENTGSSLSINSKDSESNPLFELDDGDDQFVSQSIDKSSVESDVIEYENPSSEPDFF